MTSTTFRKSTFREYFESIVIAVILALFIRTWIVQAFKIPTGSMEMSLLSGDHLLVNKFVFGPTSTLFEQVVTPTKAVQRGDILVFKYPEEPERDFIKRVIGTPGDVVSYHNKRLSINGNPLPLEAFELMNWPAEDQDGRVKTFLETIDEESHTIMIDTLRSSRSIRIKVPEGHYFVMGDNRDHSNASRYWGFVPEEFIVGKAFFIWFSWVSSGDGVLGKINWSRIGSVID